MTELNKAGDNGSLGNIDIAQGNFREQMDVVADELRQLAGNADVPQDPLNAPYILYVNPYTGSDVFVGGEFVGDSATTLERRISNQRLECGYTEARPFKTINRAAIEAAIITSREYFSQSPDAQIKALVTIQLSSGEHIVGNGSGVALSDGFSQLDNVELSLAELERFNTPDGLTGSDAPGAVILPRGCSLISLDLRKTVIRPGTLPANPNADEEPDYSNRRSIFKVTGGGYYYGLTFKDNPDSNVTHHLLHCFEFARETELDLLYQKALASFGAAGIGPTFGQTEEVEFQIVGPKPPTPIEGTDTVNSASPYIYNCSIRSVYGLAGIFANGGAVADDNGFRSMVVAQFTGVSLQRDLRCWEVYEGSSDTNKDWKALSTSSTFVQAEYDKYITADPNNIRMRIRKRSFHVRAVNDSIIQEVSVFAIGQGIHHWTEDGGELTVTNSNSNFGGCAALAQGFRRVAQQFDSNYQVREVRTAVDPLTLGNQVEQITLGFVQEVNNSRRQIILRQSLTPGRKNPDQPEVLDNRGYSLKRGDYVWIDNPSGPDYRAVLASNAFENGDTINVIAPGFETDNGDKPDSNSDGDSFALFPSLTNLRVYVRRFQDVRTVEQRRYSLRIFANQQGNRLPVRDYILQPFNDPGKDYGRRINSIRGSELAEPGVSDDVRIELNYADRPIEDSAFDGSKLYRRGDVVRNFNKHFIAREETTGSFGGDVIAFQEKFAENFVHMQELYDPDGNFKNGQPILIFDKDTQSEEVSEPNTLGNTMMDPEVQVQIVSAVDYIATRQQLENFGASDVDSLVELKSEELRDTDVSSRSGFTFELRRPSNIRLFGQAWEWAGYLNYTKALPDYQRTLSPENKFTYYFTNERGGKVFCNGFNEEGLQVSPRGLEDVTTGEVLSADNLSSPDNTINPLTELDNVSISNLTVRSYNESETKKGTRGQYGIVRLYNPRDPDRENSDNDPRNDVLTYNEAVKTFAQIVDPAEIPFQIIHVIPEGTQGKTGEASIPYGFPKTPDTLQWQEGRPFSTNLSEAFKLASTIFVPAGSSILISVHNTRPTVPDPSDPTRELSVIEQGPLQLANGFAEVIVAGARGEVDADGNPTQLEPPTIYVARKSRKGNTATTRGRTRNALARTPQYSEEFAFSAGVTFADITLDCDCNGENNTYATVNGGFGVGGYNTSVVWRDCDTRVAAIATTYGKQATFQYYNENRDTERRFIQRVVSIFNSAASDENSNFDLQLFGGGNSGLISQGCDVIFNFRDQETGITASDPKCIFEFGVLDGTYRGTVNVNLLAVGSRGGVKSGGRIRPVVDFDFTQYGNFSIRDFCNEDARSNQNYFGKSFKCRALVVGNTATNPSAATFEGGYNLNSSVVDRLDTEVYTNLQTVDLVNGCCVDINTEGTAAAGPFAFYLELEDWFESPAGGNRPNFGILKSRSSRNSFIYNSNSARDLG